MKLALLLFVLACGIIHAKDIHSLKRLATLKHEKAHTAKVEQEHRTKILSHHTNNNNNLIKRLSASVVTCHSAEDSAFDPRTSPTGHVKADSAPVTSSAPDAARKLDEWRQSESTGVWPHVEKGAVIEAVSRRLENPARIQQASAPLCGPASIIFWLVVRRPYTYITMARSLFETGEYTDDVTSYRVVATDKHKSMEVGHDMDPVDWIVLVALRTTENTLLDVDQFGDLWGVTTPGEMVGWTKKILSFANAQDTGMIVGDQSEALQRADKAVNGDSAGDAAEGVASLLVDASIVQATDTVISLPNHWIAYVANLEITETEIKFRAFTWGQLCDITANREEWQSKGFGVVWGSSPDVQF